MFSLPEPTALSPSPGSNSVSDRADAEQSRARARRPLLFILFGVLMLAVYADPLFLRRNFGGRDILGYNLPVEKAIHDAYGRGRLPVWISEISGGRPLLANPNAGALYPVRPALALLPFPLAMRVYPIAHWVLAGLGMILLVRSLGRSAAAAWTAGITYSLSGVSISEVFYSNYQPGMTLLPWLLWALHRPARRAGRIVSLAFLFALLFLAGDVFVGALALVCVIFWVVLEIRREDQKAALAVLAIAVGLAVLLAAPQIVATALWIPVTNRAILGMRLKEALLYSVSPLRLLEFVIPYPFGNTWELNANPVWGWKVFRYKGVGFFSSFYAGAFAVIAVFSSHKERTAGARFARVLLLFGLALSVLPSLVPSSLDNLHSPLPLRYPEKLAVAVILALALLCGIAFDRLRVLRHAPRWLLPAGGVLAALAGAASLWPAQTGRLALAIVGGDAILAPAAARALPPALAEAGLLWVATVIALELARRPERHALLLSLLVLTAVPVAANRRIARTFREEEVLAPGALDRYLARVDPTGDFRTVGETSYRAISALERDHQDADPGELDASVRNWDQYSHVLWHRGTVLNMDFDHGDLSRLDSLRGMSFVASSYLDSAPFFGALALRWGVRFRDQQPLGGYRPFRAVGLQQWDEHSRAYPDIRLVQRWREEPNLLAAANLVPRLGDGEVVIEGDVSRSGRARAGALNVLEKTPEKLRLSVDIPDPDWLFVLRGYWTHRQVLLDGNPVEVVPAQIAFSAVKIPPGSHRLEWEEILPGRSVSVWGPVLFALACVLLAARGRVERRRA